jgi:hypothetical protein
VEMPARRAKVANVWRRSYGRRRGSIVAARCAGFQARARKLVALGLLAHLVVEEGAGRALAPEWRPSFVDYLYLSLANSTVYSPTDTMPLSPRAKMTMAIQAVAALATIGLLVARAVGSLT